MRSVLDDMVARASVLPAVLGLMTGEEDEERFSESESELEAELEPEE